MKIGRIKSRWTLGGMMILIAVVALPLAWYSYQAREIHRQQVFAERRAALAVEQVKLLMKVVEEQAKADQERGSAKGVPTAAPHAATVEQPR